MFIRRITYFILFIFFIWLALATRHYKDWFHPLIVKYGGDIIWAGAFLLLLRVIFIKVRVWKLAVWCYTLGVLDELSQLINTNWANSVRSTTIGRLMFGVGFVWSDLLCYAIGTLLAWGLIEVMERYIFETKKAIHLNE